MINEANFQKDVSRESKARNIISYIQTKIDNFSKNTPVVSIVKVSNYDVVRINFDGLSVHLVGARAYSGIKAEYIPKDKTIYVYECEIEINPLKVKFDKDFLRHEIVHYFDIRDNEISDDVIDTAAKDRKRGGYHQYINSPLEVNAHFFEYVIPQILSDIEKKDDLPKTFDAFRKKILKDDKTKVFFESLDDKNKRKFLKRIGEYWTSILGNPHVDLTDPRDQIDNSKIEKMSQSWIERAKDRILKEQTLNIRSVLKEYILKEIAPKYNEKI